MTTPERRPYRRPGETDPTDDRPPITAGFVVHPGDGLILVLPPDTDVTPEMVETWSAHVRSEMPPNTNVVFVQGVTPIVVRRDERCDATTDAGVMGVPVRCRNGRDHDGPHEATWQTGTVSWS